MSQKQAVILHFALVGVVTLVVFGNLKRTSASSEAFALAYVLVISVAGLGLGVVITHFRK